MADPGNGASAVKIRTGELFGKPIYEDAPMHLDWPDLSKQRRPGLFNAMQRAVFGICIKDEQRRRERE